MACCSKNNLKCFILTGVVLAALVAYLDLPPPPLQPNKIEYWGPSRIANGEWSAFQRSFPIVLVIKQESRIVSMHGIVPRFRGM